jgi:hypothetical protein
MNGHNTQVVHNSPRTWLAMCSCGYISADYVDELAVRRVATEHYIRSGGAADDDSAELAASMARHPSGRRQHRATVTVVAGQLVAGCSACAWTFTGPVGSEVVEEAAGHAEAAQVLGAMGLSR